MLVSPETDEAIDEDIEALLYAQIYYRHENETQDEPQSQNNELTIENSENVNLQRKNLHGVTASFDNSKIEEVTEKICENVDESREFQKTSETLETREEQREHVTEEDPSECQVKRILNEENQESFIIPPIIPHSQSISSSSQIPDAPGNSDNSEFLENSDDIIDPSKVTPSEVAKSAEVNSVSSAEKSLDIFIPLDDNTTEPEIDKSSRKSRTERLNELLSTPLLGERYCDFDFQNNITVNQYIFGSSFNERLNQFTQNYSWSKSCQKDLNRLQRGDITEKKFFQNLRRRQKIQQVQRTKSKRLQKRRSKQIIIPSEVICISDDENSDIEIVECQDMTKDINTKEKPLAANAEDTKKTDKKNGTYESDEDEIIYIAPPPVPIVNVADSESDDGCEEEKNKKISSKNISEVPKHTEEVSNDFIGSESLQKNTSEEFNFGLHGSEFQESEFARPANPADSYETESSTSTELSNTSRQFGNTVNTIVFNEVEFPKNDFFEGSLESFGDLIVPKRLSNANSTVTKSDDGKKGSTSTSNRNSKPRTSSESSSESECEANTHQNLPLLTPMLAVETSPLKDKKKKNKNVDVTPTKKTKKNKGNTNDSIDNNLQNENAGAGKPSNRNKRKSGESNDDSQLEQNNLESSRNTLRPKRKCVEAERKGKNVENVTENVCEIKKPSKINKKSKRKSGEEKNADTVLEDSQTTTNNEVQKISRKSKRKSGEERNEDIESALEDSQMQKTPRKRKSVEVQSDESPEKTKRKKKKCSGNKSAEGEEILADDNSPQTNLQTDWTVTASSTPKVPQQSEIKEFRLEERKPKKRQKRTRKNEKDIQKTNDELESFIQNKIQEVSTINEETNVDDNHKQDTTIEQMVNEEESLIKKRKKKRRLKHRESSKNIDESGFGDSEDHVTKNKEDISVAKVVVVVEESINVSEDTNNLNESQDEDIIIVEDVSQIAQPVVYEVDSSDSEDFRNFDDVGDNLQLANTSVQLNETSVIVATSKRIEVSDYAQFDAEDLKSKMTDDPDKWKILPADKWSLQSAKKGPRCNRCRQFGHMAVKCPHRFDEPRCSLCGSEGHQEPRCPNKMCLSCANPGNYSTIFCHKCAHHRKMVCTLCGIPSHNADYCPDLWRRYYLTTQQGPPVQPKKGPTLKSRDKQWCSGCGKNGHLEFECTSEKWFREYPSASPKIYKYSDVYRKEKAGGNPKSTSTKTGDKQSQSNNVQNKAKRDSTVITPSNNSEKIDQTNANVQKATGSNQTFAHSPKSPNKSKNLRNSPRSKNPKINPVSLAKNQNFQSNMHNFQSNTNVPYKPYQPVLNPLSAYGSHSVQPRQLGLFQPVPNNLLAHQLQTLVGNNYNQNSYDAGYNNFDGSRYENYGNYQNQSLGLQIPLNDNPVFGAPTRGFNNRNYRPRGYYNHYNRNRVSEDLDFQNDFDIDDIQCGMYENFSFRDFRQLDDTSATISINPNQWYENDYSNSYFSLSTNPEVQQPSSSDMNDFGASFSSDSHQDFQPSILSNNNNSITCNQPLSFSSSNKTKSVSSSSKDPNLQVQVSGSKNISKSTPSKKCLDFQQLGSKSSNNPESHQAISNSKGISKPTSSRQLDNETFVPLQVNKEKDKGILLSSSKDLSKSTPSNKCSGFQQPGSSGRKASKSSNNPESQQAICNSKGIPKPTCSKQLNNETFVSLKVDKKKDKQMFLNDYLEKSISEKFFNGKPNEIQSLINLDLEKLSKTNFEPASYKRKLMWVENLNMIPFKTNAIVKQASHIFKQLNMFLFGQCKLRDGGKYLDSLKEFVKNFNPNFKLTTENRRSLAEAYGYVFGGKHSNVDYPQLVKKLCTEHLKKKLSLLENC